MSRAKPQGELWAQAFQAAVLAAASVDCSCETCQILKRLATELKAPFLTKEAIPATSKRPRREAPA